jgi:hypothetical protein
MYENWLILISVFIFLHTKKTETLDPPDRKPWPDIFLHKLLQAQAQLGLKVHVVVHALKLIHRVSKHKWMGLCSTFEVSQ